MKILLIPSRDAFSQFLGCKMKLSVDKAAHLLFEGVVGREVKTI